MGTKIHCKSYFPGFYSMRDLNEDSSSSSWPLFYGDKTVANGQYYNGFMLRTSADGYPGHEKDTLKQKMLEHEAVFKNQVSELHRLYRIQRDMMEEVRRKELHKHRASMEPASSSSLQGVPSEDARKWHMAGFPFSNSSYGRTPVAGLEKFNSPLSCTKWNTPQPGEFPSQNGSTSKDFEALDSRPLKVRKKLFDLQLPADEYVDPEEEANFREYKESDVSSCIPNGNPNSGAESSMKLFPNGQTGTKTDLPVDASALAPCSKRSIALVDLNEPIQIEEAMAPSSIDFLGHNSVYVETKAIHLPVKSTAGYIGVNGETMHVRDGFAINSSIESQVNERGWLSHINKAGSASGNLSYVTQGCQPDKSTLLSHPRLGMYPSGYNPWREGFQNGLESSGKSYDHYNNSRLEHVTSQTPGSYPFFSSSSFSSSWVHPVSSWAKLTTTSSFTQNVTALGTSANSAATTSRTLQPSALSQEHFVGKWNADSSSRLNPGFGSESKLSGFYHASVSGTKELRVQSVSAGFDYLNCSRGDSIASDRSSNHGFGDFVKGSYHADTKPAIDINLNEALPQGLSNGTPVLQDLNAADGKSKPEDNLPALPWLKPKLIHVNEVADASRSELSKESSFLPAASDQLCCKNETVTDLNQLFPSKGTLTCDSEISRKKEIAQTPAVKKILGFPMFERDVPENEQSSHASTSVNVDCHPEGKIVSNERKNGIIDINVVCEPDEVIAAEELTVDKEKQKNDASIKDYIDLNSCVSDSEDPPGLCYEQKGASVKITMEIDLEVPGFLESEDDSTLSKEKMPEEASLQSLENKHEKIQDEVLRKAAETILCISSCPQIGSLGSICLPSEASLAEALLWFVDVVSSYENDTSGKESRTRDGSLLQDSSEQMDDFEAMTLQLAEAKEEDYMPKPFVPEIQAVEETGANALTTRSRRGHSRRGRQRRDFQRDILPGLASLSRHEVTEDLQTFGGLMRATGYPWNSGLNRRNGRNGGARGRRRAVVETVPPAIPSPVCSPLMQQLNTIDAGLEDRSLTGWGKTTRRPRRQRCPAGNPSTVTLT